MSNQHPRLHAYRNKVWDLIDNLFSTINFTTIPREKNQLEDALIGTVTTFVPPTKLKLKIEIEVLYWPFIPDNIKHWKVFEDD